VNQIRIALVSKSNGGSGGASFFAECLGAWLLEAGAAVTHYCVEPKHKLRPYQEAIPCQKLVLRAARHLNWRARRLGILEPLPWEYWAGLSAAVSRFDLVHFHDLFMAISPRTLQLVARTQPVAFTTHDCSAFTGGCLYPLECERFTTACGGCPRRAEIGRFDFTSSNLRRMRSVPRCKGVHYIFPSKWIHREASRSLDFAGTATHIPNGFDPKPYSYREPADARRALGLPGDRKIVALSSGMLDDKRKGVAFALKALEANRDLNPFVVLIGSGTAEIEGALRGLDVLLAGFVEERARLGLFYAAANLLLFPSLADNLPITIQEAMAAGTPVLAFNVGGVPELVQEGKTGWLVPLGDQKALNRALRRALESGETANFGARAQALIANEYSRDLCVERHLELYQSAVKSWPAGNPGL